MGINLSSNVSKSEILSAVLAGIGIWSTPSPVASAKPQPGQSNVFALRSPVRITRIKDGSPQLAGRMVISGRMADVCAELDRMAA